MALTVLHTWPLATDPVHLSRLDNSDADLNTWIIAWDAYELPRAPLRLFEAPIFYPERHTLAYSEHLLVPALMGAPLIWLGASPVFVHNILFMLGMALSAWAMYLVIASWTGSWSAGLIAGLLYGFNAHVLARFAHLQAQHVEFLPIVLYAIDRVLVRGRARDVVLLVTSFVLQSLCSNYLLVFTTFAAIACVAVRPGEWRGPARYRTRIALGCAGLGVALALAPFLWPYYQVQRDQGLARSLGEVAVLAATWRDYLATGGRLHYAWWSHNFFDGTSALFPGLAAVALASIALATRGVRNEGRLRMALAVGVMGMALSFGPSLPGYAWLHTHIPLVGALRAAGRWGWLMLMTVAILAGYGVAELERRWPKARLTLLIVLAIVVTAEAMRTPIGFTTFAGIPHIYDRLIAEARAVVVEFPLYSGNSISENGPYLVDNTRYLKPLVNGYSGFQPQAFAERGERLRNFPEAPAVTELRAIGVTHVVVHVEAFVEKAGADAFKAIDAVTGLELIAEEEGIRLYRFR